MRICGETGPDFVGGANEDYGVIYPASLFDGMALPGTPTSATLSGTAPGSSFVLARSVLLFGANMSDPINGSWPGLASIMQRDSDADTKPGLTVIYKSGGGFSYVPVNRFGSNRAIRGYLASRVVFTVNGTLTSCTRSSGSASAQDIDIRTLGCRISGDSRDCNNSERDHLDNNAPNYQTQAASYSLLKVAASAGCATVRAALP
jgi:hypothetical protein